MSRNIGQWTQSITNYRQHTDNTSHYSSHHHAVQVSSTLTSCLTHSLHLTHTTHVTHRTLGFTQQRNTLTTVYCYSPGSFISLKSATRTAYSKLMHFYSSPQKQPLSALKVSDLLNQKTPHVKQKAASQKEERLCKTNANVSHL